MKACTIFSSDNEVAEDWLVKFNSREPLDIYGQKYLIDEISTDYELGFSGVTIKMYPVYQAKSPKTPKKQEAWDGVGDPPVGVVCQYSVLNGPWYTCEVGYSFFDGEHRCFVIKCQHIGFEQVCRIEPGSEGSVEFRPFRTAEQVAAEERKKAIEEMVFGVCGCEPDGGNTSAFMMCGFLYDAGYRKQ